MVLERFSQSLIFVSNIRRGHKKRSKSTKMIKNPEFQVIRMGERNLMIIDPDGKVFRIV